MAYCPYDVEKTLDDEFRRILLIIRPHIERITNNYYLTFYRMWLEKLNNIDPDQKEERNRYLVELCRQIQDVRLEHPFTQRPLPGSLQPFQYNLLSDEAPNQSVPGQVTLKETNVGNRRTVTISGSVNTSATHSNRGSSNNISESNTRKTISKETVKNASEAETRVVDVPSLVVIGTPQSLDHSMLRYEYRRKLKDSGDALKKMCICGPLNDNIEIAAVLPQMRQCSCPKSILTETKASQKKLKNVKSAKSNIGSKLRRKRVDFKDSPAKRSSEKLKSTLINPPVTITISEKSDSSWFDLTDVSSPHSRRSSDSPHSQCICRKQYDVMSDNNALENLVNAITSLQRQNLELNKDVSNTERQLSLRNIETEMNIDCLANEVRILKLRLQDLIEIKEAIKNSQKGVSFEWKGVINTLVEELQTTQEQNTELQSQIGTLHERLDQLSAENIQQNGPLKQGLSTEHQQQIEMLKTHHAQHMETLEDKFTQILNEKDTVFGEKLNFLKDIYERKISEISNECEKNMKNKNAEIKKLETTLKDQCRKIHQEVYEIRSQIQENGNSENDIDKVAFLKNCIWKIDRLYKTTERRYNKQIKKLKKQMSLKDKVIKLQLTTQKAEIVTRISSRTQTEIETTVVFLEQRYKQLLENQRTQFLIEKQNDSNLIFELRTMVASSAANL